MAWGEWRADGGQSVVSGQHPCGRDYQVVSAANPVEIAFADIRWPDDLKLPWVKSDFDHVVEAEGEPFTVSEKGGVVLNQMFFVRKYALENRVLFDSGLGEFFQYDPADGLWKKQSVETIKRGFLAALTAAARETKLASLFLKRTDGCVAGLVALLRATVETKDAFSKRPAAIHVANGMICFGGDEVTLKSFHPDYLSRNQCPFEFDPDAECPRFKKELLESALAADDVLLLQKWAGAVMLGHNAAQRFLLMLGTPGGGKSSVMNILERTIGLQNVSQLRTEHLADKFELFSFVGKTLLTGKDVASDFLMQKGAHVLKALVGHDLLEAEKKGFNERVLLRGDFNVGITCNTDLNIRLQGDAGAWRRRLLVIKYERPAPTKKNVRFAEELLEEEGQGILRWVVEGAIALLDDLRDHGDFHLTARQKDQVDRLMDQSDSVRHFVREGVVRRKGEDISASDLLVGYYEFCESRGWQPFPTNDLRVQLPKHMLEVHKSNSRHDIKRGDKSVRGYMHVGLANGGQDCA
jgi:P4 family phage/plasmid primase-like protien